ncbi:MAG TPA: cytochrome b/b6 domain-containing protein [candidate division Zixibacteria bacterium]|nr:cytochrome b/b6 domain-containing protein [candidate division Zixibacteria bacterium]
MEWLRRERNPWGQEILVGLSWDLMWVAVAVAALAVVAHAALYHWRWRRLPAGETQRTGDVSSRLPKWVLRHTLASRLFHWVMAASVLTLLGTAFLPIWGVKFAWVTPHWIAGLALTAAIAFHVVHASFYKGLGLMWVSGRDLRDGWLALKQIFDRSAPAPGKPGKNPLENKLFHHAAALAVLATIATGLAMMAKVDTPWWERNPYVLDDGTWGIIYVIHGAASVALIALILVHVYFAVRPEKRWITLSMLHGFIPRERYLEHHDPSRWPVELERSDATAGRRGEAAAR